MPKTLKQQKAKKAKKGGVGNNASLSATGSTDIEMTHPQMDMKIQESASKLSFSTSLDGNFPKTGINAEPVNVKDIYKSPAKLGKKPWGTYYRGRSLAMDELISTASVRELLSGALKGKKNLSDKELTSIEKFVNVVSDVRFPTKYSGYNYGDGRTMQHPTSKASAMWASSGKNHGKHDLARRQAIVETLEEHVQKGSSVETTLKALVVRSITHTLNAFTAPATAKDQKTLTTDSNVKFEQVKQRERLKEIAKSLGAEQDIGNDKSIDREWNDRSKKRSVSIDRNLGAKAEKEVRLSTSMGNQTVLQTLANKKAAAATVALTTGAVLKVPKVKVKTVPSSIASSRPSRKAKFQQKYPR